VAGGFPATTLGAGVVRGRNDMAGNPPTMSLGARAGFGEETMWWMGFPPRCWVLGWFQG
jgi:hypothetical protein